MAIYNSFKPCKPGSFVLGSANDVFNQMCDRAAKATVEIYYSTREGKHRVYRRKLNGHYFDNFWYIQKRLDLTEVETRLVYTHSERIIQEVTKEIGYIGSLHLPSIQEAYKTVIHGNLKTYIQTPGNLPTVETTDKILEKIMRK